MGRTTNGCSKMPCALMLAAFCVVDRFVAYEAKRLMAEDRPRSEGHITDAFIVERANPRLFFVHR